MAWDGTINRRIVSVTPNKDKGGCRILFECGHDQHSNRPVETILKWFREYPCDTCSSPHRQRIKDIRDGISFDVVLGKLRMLIVEEEE